MSDPEDLRRQQEDALRKMMDHIEREDATVRNERKILMIVGMLVLALVATVGIAMLLRAPKEQELARHRCEMEKQAAYAWKETEAVKSANPSINAAELQMQIEAKRPSFKEAAKAECASTK